MPGEISTPLTPLFPCGLTSPPPPLLSSGPMAILNVEPAWKHTPGYYPPPGHVSAGQAFAWMDRYLDQARRGPLFLKMEPIATIVTESLLRGIELGHYQLGAFAVMANHVHVLLLPSIPLARLLKSLKGSTAHQANRVLGRTGEPFWQRESCDHWVRDEEEWQRIAGYIENNPVKAGLVAVAEEYRWGSAHETWRPRLTPPSVRRSARVTIVAEASIVID